MTVKDLMETSPVTVRPEDSAAAAADVMLENQTRALPVVDAEGRLLGMVRDLDVLHLLLPGYLENLADLGFLPPDLEPGSCTLAEVCQLPIGQAIEGQDPYSVDEDEPVLEAVRVMVGRGLGTLPVLREGRLIGVLKAQRLLRHMAEAAGRADA
ncbi:MAG: CBS domain-containing protein [Armatimonadetes bacterium]|nr:CBS domain-containing protein [Armatimonadota bacterium]